MVSCKLFMEYYLVINYITKMSIAHFFRQNKIMLTGEKVLRAMKRFTYHI